MKGFKDDKGKFRPTGNQNGIRKSRDQSAKTEGVRLQRGKSIISEEEASKLKKQLKRKGGSISNEDYSKLVMYERSKASDLYKIYISKFPDSHIARDLNTAGLPSHGHFGTALFEGRYEDAMYRADSDNLRKLKEIGIEHFLSKERKHPDDPSPYESFMTRYDWAKDYRGD